MQLVSRQMFCLDRQLVLLECVSMTDDVRGERVMRELILTCLLSSGGVRPESNILFAPQEATLCKGTVVLIIKKSCAYSSTGERQN